MRYGLIGEKLGHSFSKEIHEKIADYTYDLIPLSKDEFHSFMEKKDFNAINVTIPYKKDVIPYLDSLDEGAKAIQAVNTIVNFDGKLKGYNTDYLGFKYMVNKYQVNMYNKKVLVIGNGGASAAIQAVVNNEKPKEMLIVDIVESENTITYEQCYQQHSDVEVIINTSPVGMYPKIANSPLDLSKFNKVEAVLDVIYNPLTTTLTLQAKRRNIKYANGLEMLIAQAKYAVEFFLNKNIDDAIIEEIYQEMVKKSQNIVLIGMPSCGKSTIAKLLSKELHMEMVDLDNEIVEKAHMSIPEIFAKDGESGFRKLESEVCYEFALKNGMIISCGGGVVKNKCNMDYLSLNGLVCFIDRDLSLLIADDDNRPLSSSKEAVEKLYHERIDLYRQYSDYIIENNSTLLEVVESIKNKLER